MSCPFLLQNGQALLNLGSLPVHLLLPLPPNTTGYVITLPLPITQDPQAAMAPPPPAAVTDTLADVGTIYATADTKVDANSSSTSGSIHPMVTRSRDARAFSSMQSTPHPLPSPYAALLASSSPHEPTSGIN